MNRKRALSSLAGVCSICLLPFPSPVASGQASQAQIDRGNAESFKVYNTVPVILDGPFLLDSSATSTTIEWITGTPCQPKVEYGEGKLDHQAVPQQYGLIPVGTLQKVEITGLLPGHTYQYRVVSTRVVRLKPYLSDKGLSVESPVYTFTTFDPAKPTASFSFITDTHEDVPRIEALMRMIDWKTTDFLVNGGDGVNFAQSEDQVFANWLEPVSRGLDHNKPLIYVRGNHDMRGPFARDLSRYLLAPGGQYYYTRDDGPVHLIAIDTGEDKPDNNHEYAGLLDDTSYREKEYTWLRDLVPTESRMAAAPFRVITMHQPKWGWVNGEYQKWTELANREKIDLVIAGHNHRFLHIPPGQDGNNFPILVVGQDQVARLDATSTELKVTVTTKTGNVIDSFTVTRQGEAR
jgi:predicted phosphodiesterase